MGYYLTEPIPAPPAKIASARPSAWRKKKGLGAPFLQAILSTKYCDGDLGLYYYGYRFYSPGIGRWMSRDPIGELGGVLLCGFVNNSPISWFDSLGLTACSWKVGRCARTVGNVTVPSTVTIRGRTFAIPEDIRKAVNRAIPDHHDVKVESYASTDGSGAAEETVVRGFFADDFPNAIAHHAAFLITFARVDGFVPGSVQDSALTAGPCSLSLVSEDRFDLVKLRITTSTANRYHLSRYNCQTWAAEQLVP